MTKLEKYLNENNLMEAFLKNLSNEPRQPFKKFAEFNARYGNMKYAIDNGFTWKYTPEEEDYWEDHSNKFIKQYFDEKTN